MKVSDYLRFGFLFAILIIGCVFIAVWAVIWAMRGSLLTTGLCLAATMLLLCLLQFVAYPLTGAARPRGEYGPEGTKVRPQKYVDRVFIIGLAIGVLAAASYLIFSYFNVPISFQQAPSLRERYPPAAFSTSSMARRLSIAW